jgi:hypothetical protein
MRGDVAKETKKKQSKTDEGTMNKRLPEDSGRGAMWTLPKFLRCFALWSSRCHWFLPHAAAAEVGVQAGLEAALLRSTSPTFRVIPKQRQPRQSPPPDSP